MIPKGDFCVEINIYKKEVNFTHLSSIMTVFFETLEMLTYCGKMKP
jgi:hypothetical protein